MRVFYQSVKNINIKLITGMITTCSDACIFIAFIQYRSLHISTSIVQVMLTLRSEAIRGNIQDIYLYFTVHESTFIHANHKNDFIPKKQTFVLIFFLLIYITLTFLKIHRIHYKWRSRNTNKHWYRCNVV